jgi:antitoxin component YwqK of YwqJK toxin-antitoxin module
MRLFLLFAVFLAPILLHAQDAQPDAEDRPFTVDAAFTLDLNQEEEPINTPKKKKPKKKVFYGIKTKKAFTRKGFGERTVYEQFYMLKKSEKPQTFVRDVYWFDYARKEIRKSAPNKFDPTKGILLHGPYKKFMLGGMVTEQGIYYKGTRHGRWMKYNGRDSVLLDKEKYFKGWPKESQVTYYDPFERKKVKEIIPIEYGEREGYYYLFHENGKPAVVGEFKFDQKVNDWVEYYPDGRRKKIISYPKEPFDDTSESYVRVEWNEKGREIYRKARQ